jgi:putative tricarboxylic transport membrane protein
MKRIDIIFGLIGLVLSASVFYMLDSFPEGQPGEVGADFFPYILALGLGGSSLTLVLQSLFREASDDAEPFNTFSTNIQRSGISLIATVIYCLVMDSLGFILCTMIFLPLMMLLLKERKYFQMIIVSGAITATVFIVFSSFLNITLPLGTIYGY